MPSSALKKTLLMASCVGLLHACANKNDMQDEHAGLERRRPAMNPGSSGAPMMDAGNGRMRPAMNMTMAPPPSQPSGPVNPLPPEPSTEGAMMQQAPMGGYQPMPSPPQGFAPPPRMEQAAPTPPVQSQPMPVPRQDMAAAPSYGGSAYQPQTFPDGMMAPQGPQGGAVAPQQAQQPPQGRAQPYAPPPAFDRQPLAQGGGGYQPPAQAPAGQGYSPPQQNQDPVIYGRGGPAGMPQENAPRMANQAPSRDPNYVPPVPQQGKTAQERDFWSDFFDFSQATSNEGYPELASVPPRPDTKPMNHYDQQMQQLNQQRQQQQQQASPARKAVRDRMPANLAPSATEGALPPGRMPDAGSWAQEPRSPMNTTNSLNAAPPISRGSAPYNPPSFEAQPPAASPSAYGEPRAPQMQPPYDQAARAQPQQAQAPQYQYPFPEAGEEKIHLRPPASARKPMELLPRSRYQMRREDDGGF